jgi:hypothetical protein
MKSLLAVLAALLLIPAAASAMPIDGPVSRGAAPVHAVPIQVRGTNVAAADQQSPKTAPAPVHVAAPAPGFDWGTAAIGAAFSLLLMTALLGIAVTVRRRHTVIPG